jgi:glycosyltransferase involved in cell wall biosynthesis
VLQALAACCDSRKIAGAHGNTMSSVDRDRQQHLADVLCDYRERLTGAREDLNPELDEHRIPIDPIAARMLEIETRMFDVEVALRADLDVRRRARRAPGRWLREMSTPRLVNPRQHSPQPLVVPRGYLATSPPDPAPRISIVTPSLNQGQFLERTLYSVISQNYPALEYVVQDGGSTDRSVDIVRRYARWLSHWVSEPDEGQADALNRGFGLTSGEIMAYLNADDLLLPGALAYVAGYFTAHPDIDVVYGHRIIIDGYDHQVGVHVLPAHDDQMLSLFDFVPQETLFWRRSAWEAAGGRLDASLRFALDWDLLIRMRDSGAKMVRLPRFLGAFRVHDDQKSGRWKDEYFIEANLLRERANGRALSEDEAFVRTRPYMRRHVAQHLWHRAKARLPASRRHVRTEPLEPWFRESPTTN